MLSKNMWWLGNRDFRGEVASPKINPIIVDGKPFYDMVGYLSEFVSDYYQDQIQSGYDPVGGPPSDTVVTKGPNFLDHDEEILTPTLRRQLQTDQPDFATGFRLIRVKN